MKDTTSSIIKCGNALLSCALRLKELVPITLSIKILIIKEKKLVIMVHQLLQCILELSEESCQQLLRASLL